MKKIYYHKLVRDKIPDIIVSRGSSFKVATLKPVQYGRELLKKVSEEASGLLAAKDKKELISELADLIDVIEEVKHYKKITSLELANARRKNNKFKGGFKKRLFLIWSSDDGYQTNEKRNSQKR